jgi:hypothetical protein
MRSHGAASTIALRALTPAERVAAVADRGSVRSVTASFDAPRPSPHLARWGIAAQDDDGIVVARATIDGAPVLVAAQDERFLGGSAGANHADTLRRLVPELDAPSVRPRSSFSAASGACGCMKPTPPNGPSPARWRRFSICAPRCSGAGCRCRRRLRRRRSGVRRIGLP